jgi:hypothetical protein
VVGLFSELSPIDILAKMFTSQTLDKITTNIRGQILHIMLVQDLVKVSHSVKQPVILALAPLVPISALGSYRLRVDLRACPIRVKRALTDRPW